MSKEEKARVLTQLRKVLVLLRKQSIIHPTPMLKMIISRYQHAHDLLESRHIEYLNKEMFQIRGSVRAYLESYTDYMNPVLGEMDKAEKMLHAMITRKTII